MNSENYFNQISGPHFGRRTDLFIVEFEKYLKLDNLAFKIINGNPYFISEFNIVLDIYDYEDYHVGDKMRNPKYVFQELKSRIKDISFEYLSIGFTNSQVYVFVVKSILKRKPSFHLIRENEAIEN